MASKFGANPFYFRYVRVQTLLASYDCSSVASPAKRNFTLVP